LRAAGRWWTFLGGGDGVFDGVVVGDAAAVFPVHSVCAVIWEGAAVAGKRGGVSFLGSEVWMEIRI
jgi:hypothetical protein